MSSRYRVLQRGLGPCHTSGEVSHHEPRLPSTAEAWWSDREVGKERKRNGRSDLRVQLAMREGDGALRMSDILRRLKMNDSHFLQCARLTRALAVYTPDIQRPCAALRASDPHLKRTSPLRHPRPPCAEIDPKPNLLMLLPPLPHAPHPLLPLPPPPLLLLLLPPPSLPLLLLPPPSLPLLPLAGRWRAIPRS